jgi:hypothetical protein
VPQHVILRARLAYVSHFRRILSPHHDRRVGCAYTDASIHKESLPSSKHCREREHPVRTTTRQRIYIKLLSSHSKEFLSGTVVILGISQEVSESGKTLSTSTYAECARGKEIVLLSPRVSH